MDTKKDDHGERSVLYRHHYPPRGRWWLKGDVVFVHSIVTHAVLVIRSYLKINVHNCLPMW